MVTSILELWRSRRGRRTAVATIAPLVERSRDRLHGIPDSIWLDPYMVGFVAMLITLVAKREVKEIDQPSLALVQCEAWAEITGMNSELIGEEILCLCTTENADFELGCHNALAFSEALTHAPMVCLGDGEHCDPSSNEINPRNSLTFADNSILSTLWSQYFDTQIRAAASGPMIANHLG